MSDALYGPNSFVSEPTTVPLDDALAAVIADLVGLGSGPNEVANSLKAAGVKGARRCSRTCIIAQYAKDRLDARHPGNNVTVRVACENVTVYGVERPGHPHKVLTAVMPDAVQTVIRWFDEGMLPELETGR